jgi:hypothetical protein
MTVSLVDRLVKNYKFNTNKALLWLYQNSGDTIGSPPAASSSEVTTITLKQLARAGEEVRRRNSKPPPDIRLAFEFALELRDLLTMEHAKNDISISGQHSEETRRHLKFNGELRAVYNTICNLNKKEKASAKKNAKKMKEAGFELQAITKMMVDGTNIDDTGVPTEDDSIFVIENDDELENLGRITANAQALDDMNTAVCRFLAQEHQATLFRPTTLLLARITKSAFLWSGTYIGLEKITRKVYMSTVVGAMRRVHALITSHASTTSQALASHTSEAMNSSMGSPAHLTFMEASLHAFMDQWREELLLISSRWTNAQVMNWLRVLSCRDQSTGARTEAIVALCWDVVRRLHKASRYGTGSIAYFMAKSLPVAEILRRITSKEKKKECYLLEFAAAMTMLVEPTTSGLSTTKRTLQTPQEVTMRFAKDIVRSVNTIHIIPEYFRELGLTLHKSILNANAELGAALDITTTTFMENQMIYRTSSLSHIWHT